MTWVLSVMLPRELRPPALVTAHVNEKNEWKVIGNGSDREELTEMFKGLASAWAHVGYSPYGTRGRFASGLLQALPGSSITSGPEYEYVEGRVY